MAAVNNFYDEELTAQTTQSATFTNTSVEGNLPVILGSALTGSTKYLIVARGIIFGDGVNDTYGLQVNANETGGLIAAKSEGIQEVGSTSIGSSYFFVHSFTTNSTPTNVEFEFKSDDTGQVCTVDQLSLSLMDLDDLGSSNFFETINADPGAVDDVSDYQQSLTVEWTIAGSDLGTNEWAILAYQRTGVDVTTLDYTVEAHAAVDTSTSAVRARDGNEGEDLTELRMSGFALRHKASSGTPDFEIQTFGEAQNSYFDRGGYGIAIKKSALPFEWAYTAATTTLDTTERTLETITSYSPTTTADHLVFGMYTMDDGSTGNSATLHIEDDAAEMRVGDAGRLFGYQYDNTVAEPHVILFHQDNILSSDTSTYTMRGTASVANVAAHRWLLILSLELAAAGGAGNASPATIAQAFTVDAVTQTGPGNITPAATVRSFTVDAVTLLGQTSVRPAAIARSFTVDAPTLQGPGNITPDTIARSFTVDLPALTGPGNITPSAIVRVFTIDLVTLLGQATVRPDAIARAFTIDAVTVSGPGNVTPGTIVRVFVLPAVTTSDSGAPAVPAFRLFIQDPGVW